MKNHIESAKNNWIYQSNKLIEASYTLTVIEQKLIRLLASMIKKDDTDFKEYKFKTKDLIKILNTSDSRFYRDIDNITDLLMQRIIKIKDISNGEFEKYHWVDVAKYKKGVLILKINKDLKPFYLSLDWYTKYQFKNIMQFKSTYSFRMYELLKQYEKIGYRIITINEIRSMLDIKKNKYPKYANLKQKVIKVSINEININTDLFIDYEEVKESRKITSIKFYIKSKVQDKARNEIVVSLEDKESDYIKEVKSILDEEITNLQAKQIYDAAKGNIDLIKEKYNIAKESNNIKSIVAFMVSALKEDYKGSISKKKVDRFNDFEQRSYDFKKLESQLLGWEK
ncbi:replication initiation protein [Clostridium botulinum]|uniref:Replication initiation protein n=1 Tax=Clostridium botulinum TaxID=1491 RepID=A0A6G4HXU3_CLOBO|nr:replication initiation protein [Clostridium botulinum]MBD5589604.1 replication initiation protein [Clostridium botulinum]MBO0572416.1 RepB family plasmid replication initiator protein [Clostridium botulinum]MBO0582285.1 RepB family plasmid replication initiator protein [Clostridium botulinum]NFI47810.1 replication initiation protein [Clostridium botulinum]NFJ62569.1 replication initiation protein [Clostridium botulinum]